MMTPKQEDDLIKAICRMLLPLVSPHNLSDEAIKCAYFNHPTFRNCVDQIFHLITDNPMTLEKVLNDMKIMADLGIQPPA